MSNRVTFGGLKIPSLKSSAAAETSIGDGTKRILDVERELRDFAVRRIQATKDIKKGEKFVENYNVNALRPGRNG